MIERKLDVLLVEDSLIEIMKMQRAIPLLQLKHTINETKNADEALAFLENNSLPDIILLDLNMPKISGIEFLSIIKQDERYKHVPIIILTTSDNQKDLLECYRIGISGYILKPLRYEDHVQKIKTVLEYWSMNELKIA